MRWCLPYALCDESLQASYGTVPTYSALACQVRRHRAERYYTPRRRQFLPPGLLRPDLDVEYCTQSRRGQTAYNVRPFQELTGNRSQFSSCSTRNASGTAYCDATGTHQPRPTLSTAQGQYTNHDDLACLTFGAYGATRRSHCLLTFTLGQCVEAPSQHACHRNMWAVKEQSRPWHGVPYLCSHATRARPCLALISWLRMLFYTM